MRAPERQPGASISTGPIAAGAAVAVSPHVLASQAAVDVMASGGNAVDAAVALNAVLGVVLPDTCGPGGDLFALIHRPGEAVPAALNSSGRAGTGADAAALRDRGLEEIVAHSPESITVPGCVDGWSALVERFGTKPLAELLEPAIDLASNGFPVSPELASSLARYRSRLIDQPSAFELYPEGSAPEAGRPIRRPAMAETLRKIAGEGRDAFYLQRLLPALAEATHGLITRDDVALPQAEWIDPIGLEVFDRTGWTIPPNSQGYLTLAALWVFTALDPPHEPADPRYQHLLIEAYRAVAWERADLVSDPATAPLRPDALLDPARLAGRAASIDPDRTTTRPAVPPAPGGTAYMCTMDASGVGVSLIQSNYMGIGSGISAGDTGVWLHNRGAGFTLIPGHPNELRPGKRPMHTLSPTMWTRDGALDLILGTRGGDQQPQYLAQVAAHHFHAGWCTDDAQSFPRWWSDRLSGPSVLSVESRFPDSTTKGLRARGHEVAVADAWEGGWGPVSMIDASDGVRASADPRITTSAAITT